MSDTIDPYIRPSYSDQFASFYTELKRVMDASGHLYINIYTDQAGTSAALDTLGAPIQHRLVKYVMYTYSSAEYAGSQSDKGGLRIVFMDNNARLEFFNTEPIILYWYTIDGINPQVLEAFT
jgi:hypothetical protein